MGGKLSTDAATTARRADEHTTTKRKTTSTVAVILRDTGLLPAFGESDGGVLDPSPLRSLSRPQRMRRLVGMLELLSSYGDGGAASECLRHYRWEIEMQRGKAPQRIDLATTGEIRVVDTLSAPPGTPIARPRQLRAQPA